MKTLLFVVLFLAFADVANAQMASTNRGQVLSASGGRFVFGQINESGQNVYMLDTQNGRVWRLMMDGGGNYMLMPVLYASVVGTLFVHPPSEDEERDAIDKNAHKDSGKWNSLIDSMAAQSAKKNPNNPTVDDSRKSGIKQSGTISVK